MYKLGWKRDLPDFRDIYLETEVRGLLPPTVDLRTNCPPVYDQGQLGSCTANAIAAHLDFNRKHQNEKFITPSRLFIYYNERLEEGSIEQDAGASIRTSVKEVVKYGAPPEKEWPYVIEKFTWTPAKKAYADAVKYEALKYMRVKQNELDIKSCLASGFPMVAGISVYSSFETASGGQIPMPAPTDSLKGGHAIVVVGYQNGQWICRNSWGESWGDKGYFYLPTAYLLNPDLSDDFWTLRQVK